MMRERHAWGFVAARSGGFRFVLAGSALALAGCAGEVPEVETYMVEDIEVRTDGNRASEVPYGVDRRSLVLEPGDGKEFKYRLAEGGTMLYAWEATGPVRVEMHSEEDGQPDGTAEFFDVMPSGTRANGTFTAPFPGIHGWYWENLSETESVTVTLWSSGFYTYGAEFPSGQTHQLDDVIEASAVE